MTDVQTRPTRSRRKVVLTVLAVVVVIGVAVGLTLFQPWKIFTRNTVDEALPTVAAVSSQVAAPPLTTVPPTAPPLSNAAVPPASAGPQTGAESPGAATSAEPASQEPPSQEPASQEPPVAAEPQVLASGTFVDGEHATSGTAVILQLPDGSRFLRLEGFSTSDGPDVDVALTDVAAGGEWGSYDDGRYVHLGDLKGTDGNQNYAIPADVDLAGLTSVVIWCDRFNVAFGTAAVTL